jgi:hypothetical protein
MKTNPEEAATFLQNWNKLDSVVRRELQVDVGGRKKRKNTRKKKRYNTK